MTIQDIRQPAFPTLVRSPYSGPTADLPRLDRVQLGGSPDATPEEGPRWSAGKVALALAMAVPALAGITSSAPSLALRAGFSQTPTNQDESVTQANVQLVTDDDQALVTAQSLIQNACNCVRIETTELSGVRGETIARALVGKAQEGKTVQVLVDKQNYKKDAANRVWVDFMIQNHLDVRFYDGLDNNNLLVVDSDKAFVGSSAFAAQASHDHNLLIQGPGGAVDQLRKQWDAEMDCNPVGPPTTTFRPSDPGNPPPASNARLRVMDGRQTRDRLLSLIGHAHHDIQMEMHGLADRDVIQALQAARDRGVQINLMLNNATSPFSSVDNLGAAQAFSAPMENTVPVRWYQSPDTGSLGSHVAIFDDTDVIMGTTDLASPGVARSTRSLSVEMDSPDVLTDLNLQFIQDWQQDGIDPNVMLPEGLWNSTTPVPATQPTPQYNAEGRSGAL